MKLLKSERVWAPPESPSLWTAIPEAFRPPLTLEKLLVFQERMGERLTQEASPESLSMANDALEESAALGPGERWSEKTPRLLIENPATGPQREWRARLEQEAKKPHPISRDPKAIEAMENLKLGGWAEGLLL